MAEKMKTEKSPELERQPEELFAWRARLVRGLLRFIAVLGFVSLLAGSYNAYVTGNPQLITFYLAGYGLLLLSAFLPKVPYVVQAGGLLLFAIGMAALNLVNWGLSSDGRLFLLVVPLLALFFFGRYGGIWAFLFSGLMLIVFSVAFVRAPIVVPAEVQGSVAFLSSSAGVSLLLAGILLFSLDYLLNRFSAALRQSRELVGELEVSRGRAEEEAVRAQRQAERLAHAADLARIMARLHSRDEFKQRVMQELAVRFGFAHVDLFTIDRQSGRLVLAAVYGEQGEAWLEKGLELAVGVDSLPGRAVQLGREEITTASDSMRYANSRVELALPLVVRGDVSGVLDIYTERSGFEEEERRLLRILADQIAAFLDTLYLLEDAETRSQEMHRLYARSTAESWGALLEEEHLPFYKIGEVPEKQARRAALEALRTRESVVEPLEQGEGHLLVVPLLARGIPLGFLSFVRQHEGAGWDSEAIALAEEAGGRLGSALDNTRLLLESRRRAFFEEQLGHVGDLVWSSASSDTIMEQSVRELGHLLGASEVTLYLVPPEVSPLDSGTPASSSGE